MTNDAQSLRDELRVLIHDTLAQSLFSAATIASLLADKVNTKHGDTTDLDDNFELVSQLKVMLEDAVKELKAIQRVLHDG